MENVKWQWSQLLFGVCGSLDEVFIDSRSHLDASVLSEMQLICFGRLKPVLPTVRLDSILVLIPIPVVVVPGGLTHAVRVEAGVEGGGVGKVELSDFGIKPINFLNLIKVVLWLRAIIVKPG